MRSHAAWSSGFVCVDRVQARCSQRIQNAEALPVHFSLVTRSRAAPVFWSAASSPSVHVCVFSALPASIPWVDRGRVAFCRNDLRAGAGDGPWVLLGALAG